MEIESLEDIGLGALVFTIVNDKKTLYQARWKVRIEPQVFLLLHQLTMVLMNAYRHVSRM